MMDLLVDLHVASVRQDPDRMVREAYALFAGTAGPAPRGGQMHHVPFELILSPAMRRLLPEGGEAKRPRSSSRSP